MGRIVSGNQVYPDLPSAITQGERRSPQGARKQARISIPQNGKHVQYIITRRTRVYCAGPYSNAEADNTRRAINVGTALRNAGYAPYIPHLSHFWHIVEPASYDAWLKLSLEFVYACDVLLRLEGVSPGADREVARARKLGLPVYYSLDTLFAMEPTTQVMEGKR